MLGLERHGWQHASSSSKRIFEMNVVLNQSCACGPGGSEAQRVSIEGGVPHRGRTVQNSDPEETPLASAGV